MQVVGSRCGHGTRVVEVEARASADAERVVAGAVRARAARPAAGQAGEAHLLVLALVVREEAGQVRVQVSRGRGRRVGHARLGRHAQAPRSLLTTKAGVREAHRREHVLHSRRLVGVLVQGRGEAREAGGVESQLWHGAQCACEVRVRHGRGRPLCSRRRGGCSGGTAGARGGGGGLARTHGRELGAKEAARWHGEGNDAAARLC